MLRAPAQRPSARIGSLVVNPGGPGVPGTDYAAQSASGPAASRCWRATTSSASTPGAPARSAPVDCLSDAAARRVHRPPTRTRTPPPSAASTPSFVARVRGGLRGALRRAGLARHDRRGGPRPGRPARRARRVHADLPRRVLRHQARGDVRRAVPAPGRPARPRRRGRPVGRLAPAQPRAGARVRDRAARLRRELRRRRPRAASSATRSRRGWPGSSSSLERGRRAAAAHRHRPRAPGRQRLLRHRAAALQPRLLVDPAPGAAGSASTATARSLLRLSDLYSSRNEQGGYADNSAEAIYAISCLDDPYAIAASQVPAEPARPSRGPRRPSAPSSPGA